MTVEISTESPLLPLIAILRAAGWIGTQGSLPALTCLDLSLSPGGKTQPIFMTREF